MICSLVLLVKRYYYTSCVVSFTPNRPASPWAQDQGLADEGTEKLLFMRSPSQTAAEGCRVGVQGGLSGSGGWERVCCLSGD